MEINNKPKDISFNAIPLKYLSKVISEDGTRIAHQLAEEDNLPKCWISSEVLLLNNLQGKTVAAILLAKNKLPQEYMTSDILKLPTLFSSYSGNTIAHYLTRYKYNELPEKYMSEEILCLRNNELTTPAHNLAANGNLPKKFQTQKILELENIFGISVKEKLNMHAISHPGFGEKINKFLRI